MSSGQCPLFARCASRLAATFLICASCILFVHSISAEVPVDKAKYDAGKAVFDRAWAENPKRRDIKIGMYYDAMHDRITELGKPGDAALYDYYLLHTFNYRDFGGYSTLVHEGPPLLNEADAEERHRDYLKRVVFKWGNVNDPAAVKKWQTRDEPSALAQWTTRFVDSSQRSQQRADIGGAMCSIVIVIIAFPVLAIVLLIWVARDAKARNMDSSVVWMLFVFFVWPIGIPVYLASRPKGELIRCGHCGNKRLRASAKCPHCGNP